MSFGSSPPLGSQAPQYNALRVQTSTQGMVIPVVFGTTRISGNLIWAGFFEAIPHKANTMGGKGFGGGASGSVEYTYTICFEMGLCEGTIAGIGKCWRNKEVHPSPPSDLVIFLGAYPQVPWSFLTSTPTRVETLPVPTSGPYEITVGMAAEFLSDIQVIWQSLDENYQVQSVYFTKVSGSPGAGEYSVSNGIYTFNSANSGFWMIISYIWGPNPLEALGYPGLAYVASPNFDLGKSDALPNMTFEVQGLNIIGGGLVDANGADIITAIVTHAKFGLGLSSSFLSVSDYSTWCLAANLLLSPAFTSQQNASDQIQQILDETFSTCRWHDCSVLEVIPYGDTQVTANGQTWNPNLTPAYALTDDDYLGDSSKDPVKVHRKSPADAYNNLKIECLDRNNDYNPHVVEFMDQGSIDAYLLRPDDTKQMHDICDVDIASHLVQLMGQRAVYIRNEYNFPLGWAYCLLEPMDIVTLTDSGLGLNKYPVRITSIEENDNGDLDITAEDFPQGVGHAATYTRQTSDGFNVNYNIDPGNINFPIIFTAPASIAQQNEVWVALSGGPDWGGADIYISTDDSSYKFLQRIYGASRFGILSDSLASHADPDTDNTLSVDLTPSRGQLLSGTQADADNDVTLCIVGNELISYETATLGAHPYNYDLTYLRRGQCGTPIASHSALEPFVRLDESVVKIPIDYVFAGSSFYLKFCSFNTWQGGIQSLGDPPSYRVDIPPNATIPLVVGGSGYGNFSLMWYYRGNESKYAAWGILLDGSGGSTDVADVIRVQTGTGSSSTSHLYRLDSTLYTSNPFNLSKSSRFKISGKWNPSVGDSTTCYIRCGECDASENSYGFYLDGSGNLYGRTSRAIYPASPSESTLLLQAISADTIYTLEAVLVAGSAVYFWVDGIYKGNIATNIPYQQVYAKALIDILLNNGTGGVARKYEAGEAWFWQDPY